MVLRLTALAMAVLVAACVGADPERGRGAVNGAPSTDPTTVFLYQYREVPAAGGGTARVTTGTVGTGVLLCPNAVLTVGHVADEGVFAVTRSQRGIEGWADALATDSSGTQRKVRVALVPREEARVVGAPAVRSVNVRYRVAGQVNKIEDGLAMYRIDPPYASTLPYPAVSGKVWTAGQRGEAHGYGIARTIEDAGLRRTAALSFSGYLGMDRRHDGQLLLFDSPAIGSGDSGGPVFGPLPDRALAGIIQGGSEVESAAIPIAYLVDWVQRERDRICGARGRQQAAADPAATDSYAMMDEASESLHTAADALDSVGEDEDLCLCDPDCDTACTEADEPGDPDDDDEGCACDTWYGDPEQPLCCDAGCACDTDCDDGLPFCDAAGDEPGGDEPGDGDDAGCACDTWYSDPEQPLCCDAGCACDTDCDGGFPYCDAAEDEPTDDGVCGCDTWYTDEEQPVCCDAGCACDTDCDAGAEDC